MAHVVASRRLASCAPTLRAHLRLLLALACFLWPVVAAAAPPSAVEAVTWSSAGCTRSGCHARIEPIRQPDSEMMQRIQRRGAEAGDPDGFCGAPTNSCTLDNYPCNGSAECCSNLCAYDGFCGPP